MACLLCPCRTYRYDVQVWRPGTFVNQAQLLYTDSNPNNDKDNATVTALGTCGDPNGDGTRPDCGAGSMYLGPNSKPLTSVTSFQTDCCVSVMMVWAGCQCLALFCGLTVCTRWGLGLCKCTMYWLGAVCTLTPTPYTCTNTMQIWQPLQLAGFDAMRKPPFLY